MKSGSGYNMEALENLSALSEKEIRIVNKVIEEHKKLLEAIGRL